MAGSECAEPSHVKGMGSRAESLYREGAEECLSEEEPGLTRGGWPKKGEWHVQRSWSGNGLNMLETGEEAR